MKIDEGDFDGVSLGGLSFVVVMYTPGKMTNADWTTAPYVDERATQGQRALLGRILSGETGGPMEQFIALKANFLGTQYVPIAFNGNSQIRSVSILPGFWISMWRESSDLGRPTQLGWRIGDRGSRPESWPKERAIPIRTTAWTGTTRERMAITPNFNGPKQFQQPPDETW